MAPPETKCSSWLPATRRSTVRTSSDTTVATTDYDHFRDFRLGAVQAEGIDTTWSMLGHHEIFARYRRRRARKLRPSAAVMRHGLVPTPPIASRT